MKSINLNFCSSTYSVIIELQFSHHSKIRMKISNLIATIHVTFALARILNALPVVRVIDAHFRGYHAQATILLRLRSVNVQ